MHCSLTLSQDLELEEIKLKDYLKKKETVSLIVTAKQRGST